MQIRCGIWDKREKKEKLAEKRTDCETADFFYFRRAVLMCGGHFNGFSRRAFVSQSKWSRRTEDLLRRQRFRQDVGGVEWFFTNNNNHNHNKDRMLFHAPHTLLFFFFRVATAPRESGKA